MARRMINISFDVMKLNKSKFRKKGDAVYCDITAIETPDGKYGQWMIVQDQTKEEREAKTKGTILGNGKNRNWGSSSDGGQSTSSSGSPSGTPSVDDMPF